MKITVNISLIENSTAGNLPKLFVAQEVEITHENDTAKQGVDGHISRASHPSKIVWFNGRADSLKNITDIKITQNSGNVLFDGELNTNYEMPRNIDNGVIFYVLART
jgi:hypothetical protein